MAALLQGKDLSTVRVPLGGDKVYKDECIYCFDSPVRSEVQHYVNILIIHLQESEGGLYVSLSSFLGLSRRCLEMHYQKTKESLYLLIKKTKKVL